VLFPNLPYPADPGARNVEFKSIPTFTPASLSRIGRPAATTRLSKLSPSWEANGESGECEGVDMDEA